MTTLYDHRGRPVTPSHLTRDHADPERDPRLSPLREDVAAILSPELLAGLLREADEGDPLAYLTLAEEMEERELHYRSVLSQRKAGVTGAQVAVEAASDSGPHRQHADAVRELTRRDAFHELVFNMQDALGKGYSINEIRWRTDNPDGLWWPEAYLWRDPRWYRFDLETLDRLRLDDGTPEGSELPPWKYVFHRARLKSGVPVRDGLARLASIAYVMKRYTIAQLVRFLEVYGIPVRVGRYPAGTGMERKRELLRALKKIGSDAATIIPADMQVEFLDGQRSRGNGAEGFIGVANFWDLQLSKAVLHQTMTTDSGASYSQSQTHDRVRTSAAAHDCRMTTIDINRDLVRPFVDLNFGPQSRYPRIAISVVEADELMAWSRAVSAFVDRGLAVDERHVRARLGLAEPEPGAQLLTPPPMGSYDPGGPRPAPGAGDEEE